MMQLLTAVQKNNQTLILEKIALSFSIVATLTTCYLYGQYNGFVRGSKSATETLLVEIPKFSGSGRPAYEFISEEYFFILATMLLILIICLVTNGILSKFIIMGLLTLPIYGFYNIFRLKFDISKTEVFDGQYFNIVRQTQIFDIVGIATTISLLIVEIILIFLILKNRRKIN
jgi:hypothetical protein